MKGQTVILRGASQRDFAKAMIDRAPADAVVNIRAASRTNDQNALMWALISDVSRAKPEGRMHTAETWKALFMKACGHAVQFEMGLDGEPFPLGFRSSHLTKQQMTDLIEFILWWGSERGVRWRSPGDRDGSPEGRDAQRLDGGAATARAEGIARKEAA